MLRAAAGHRATVSALLYDHCDRVPWLFSRRVPAEPRVVVLPLHLCRTGLARHGRPKTGERALGGACLRHVHEPALDDPERLAGDAGIMQHFRRDRPNDLALAAEDVLEHVRSHDDAIIGDAGIHERHLQWRGEHVALSDGHVHGVARQPHLVLGVVLVVPLLPCRIRHAPGNLTRQVDPRLLTQTELSGGRLELLQFALVQLVSDLVEDHITRVLDTSPQAQRAVTGALPATLGPLLAHLGPAAGAVIGGVLRGDARFEPGDRGDHLERGCRRVRAHHHAVVQGILALLGCERLPLGRADAAEERRRIVRGPACGSKHLAGLHVEHHRCRRLRARVALPV